MFSHAGCRKSVCFPDKIGTDSFQSELQDTELCKWTKKEKANAAGLHSASPSTVIPSRLWQWTHLSQVPESKQRAVYNSQSTCSNPKHSMIPILSKVWHGMNLGTQPGQRLPSPVGRSIQLTLRQATAPPSREGYGANTPGICFHLMKEVIGNSQQGFTKGRLFLNHLILSNKTPNGFTD